MQRLAAESGLILWGAWFSVNLTTVVTAARREATFHLATASGATAHLSNPS